MDLSQRPPRPGARAPRRQLCARFARKPATGRRSPARSRAFSEGDTSTTLFFLMEPVDAPGPLGPETEEVQWVNLERARELVSRTRNGGRPRSRFCGHQGHRARSGTGLNRRPHKSRRGQALPDPARAVQRLFLRPSPADWRNFPEANSYSVDLKKICFSLWSTLPCQGVPTPSMLVFG